MEQLKINWFPGHMKKAVDEIKNKLKEVDFIIEVVDARGITITSNNEIESLIVNKPIIKIALKADLSDLTSFDDILFISTKNKKDRNLIVNKLNDLFKDKIQKLKAKGLLVPEFIGLVIGLPNVGKSSLINFLSSSSNLKVENRSGVTKKQVIKRINDNFFLIDTPGIFFKNINDFDTGAKLVLLNNVNREVVPIESVLENIYSFFVENYHKQLKSFYGFETQLSFIEFVEFIGEKYKFKDQNNSINYNRTYQFILDNFSNSLVTKFHF